MSKYTAEQVENIVKGFSGYSYTHHGIGTDLIAVAQSYAALLRERESAKAAVTDEMVDIALTTMYGEQFADISGKAEEIFRQHMRAALEAVAPMLASARVPEAADYHTPHPETGEDRGTCCMYAYSDGWNDCRNAMLAAAPKPRTEEGEMDWQPIETAPLNEVVNTVIADESGPRNIQPLIARQRAQGCRVMWFFPDKSMYVYYTPTHWKRMEKQP